MYIDTHCHLDSTSYDSIQGIIKRVENNILIMSGFDHKSNQEVVELCKKYSNIYGTLGIHPNEIDDHIDEHLQFIKKHLHDPKIVGVGEIGLDYHFDNSSKQKQQKYFKKQIEIAIDYHKTIVIHSRDAAQDTYDILKSYDLSTTKVVMHCYSYSLELAKQLIQMNVKLGIGGVITFKNSCKLKEIVKELDLSHFVLETDSPYLAPEPYRGKKNEPSYIIYVAKMIADLKDISIQKVFQITTSNAISQFDLTHVV